MMPQSFLFIYRSWCTNTALVRNSLALHWCIMLTLCKCIINPIGLHWYIPVALVTNSTVLLSCIMSTKGNSALKYYATLKGLINLTYAGLTHHYGYLSLVEATPIVSVLNMHITTLVIGLNEQGWNLFSIKNINVLRYSSGKRNLFHSINSLLRIPIIFYKLSRILQYEFQCFKLYQHIIFWEIVSCASPETKYLYVNIFLA